MSQNPKVSCRTIVGLCTALLAGTAAVAPVLAATAVIALTMGGAGAAQFPSAVFTGPKANPITRHTPGLTVLWNENNSSNGYYINSQNYTSNLTGPELDDQGADAFVVPTGSTWTVNEVDVTGCCSGSPISENVYFYKESRLRFDTPGKLVKNGSFTGLNGGAGPNFAISLPGTGVRLRAGTYWVSVVANCAYVFGCGQWYWGLRNDVLEELAVWQQPSNAFLTGCTYWTYVNECAGLGLNPLNFMVDLQGTSKSK